MTHQPATPAPANAEIPAITEGQSIEPGTGAVTYIPLGDASGDDKRLASALREIADRLGEKKAKRDNFLISLISYYFRICALVANLLARAILSFLDMIAEWHVKYSREKAEAALILAEAERVQAEAEAIRARVYAEATRVASEAVVKQARAEQKKAEAEALREGRKSVSALVELLRARGIDWSVEIGDDNSLRIMITKDVAGQASGQVVRSSASSPHSVEHNRTPLGDSMPDVIRRRAIWGTISPVAYVIAGIAGLMTAQYGPIASIVVAVSSWSAVAVTLRLAHTE